MRRHAITPALRAASPLPVTVPVAVMGAIALTAAPGAAHAAAAEYTVQPGDTVSAIAARHGIKTAEVLTANGLGWSSIIQPGQKLRVGAVIAPPSGAAAAPPAPAATGHIVSAGDTISGIAHRHGVTTDAVLAANGLDRASIIYPGQSIVVPAPSGATAALPTVAGLDAEQVGNALVIVRIGRELGVPDRGIAIALGTAMQESWLRNLAWGDRDSLGLFQQRPSMGWGTEADALDPAHATRAFFGGAGDPNGQRTRGLLDIPGWESMGFADAAQAVQISAYPERYAQWEAPAALWLASLT